VCPTFGFGYVPAVVYGKEDVGGFGEVREGVAEGAWVGGLEEHEGHAWAEEDDVGVLEFGEVLVFEVSTSSKRLMMGRVREGESDILLPE